MRIERVDLMIVRMPLLRPFETSSSRRLHLEHILVKIYADGLVGWGECAVAPDPYYCEETTETCWHMLETFLVPPVLGREWNRVEDIVEMFEKVKQNRFAKAGLEMASWDILAQAAGQPLYVLLGGSRKTIESGVSLGIEQDVERLCGLIDRFLEEGYRRIKLKIAPGRDVDVVRRVRERHPEVPLMVDANSAYRLSDLPILKALDDFKLMLIEQPLAHDDIVDHATLQREIRTPVCLDESIHSSEDARKALDLESCRVINVKVSRLGGLLEAKRVHDLCRGRGVPVWCGGMHEYGIGRAANVAIASLPGFSMPGDVSGSDKYYAEDLVDPPIRAVNGSIAVPQVPGLGYSTVEGRVRRHTQRILSLT